MEHNHRFSFEETSRRHALHEQEHLSHHSREYSDQGPQHPYYDGDDAPALPQPVSPPAQFPSPTNYSRVSLPAHQHLPSAHSDSNFVQARRARNNSFDGENHRPASSSSSHPAPYPEYSQAYSGPPPPPAHRRKPVGQASTRPYSGHDQAYLPTTRPASSLMASTDGAADGQTGRIMERSSLDAAGQGQEEDGELQGFPDLNASRTRRSYIQTDSASPSAPTERLYMPQRPGEPPGHLRSRGSYSSSQHPITAGAATPGSITPVLPHSEVSGQSFPMNDYQSRQMPGALSPYHDSPYQNSALNFAPQVSQADINPQNIADDGDDGFMPSPKRKSLLGMRRASSNEGGTSAAPAGGAAAGGIMGAIGGITGRKLQKSQMPASEYDRVAQPGQVENGSEGTSHGEKSEWLSRQTKGNNKMRWVVGLVIGVVVILAVVGGIVGGVLGARSAANKSGGGGGGNGDSPGDSINNAGNDQATNGDLNKNSAEIKKLMNNANLHKVFPAMDYTPWGTQYPLCLTYPPSQNNITRDMAVLSQLTNTVRLYGTDCNQTEMVLHSIDQLGVKSMKVWLGVWIETNTTTNSRQLEQMYTILKRTSDHSIFKGVIVGNEALYRAGLDKAASQQNLIEILTEVKSNFTSLKYDLPVATSDLGDNWNGQLVQAVDAVMSNIHPFFAGVPVEQAAGWTWDFWQTKDAPLTLGTNKPQIISETGWPSAGGNDCGTLTTACPTSDSGSVAGIKQMNTFMDDFVCQALDNGTDYFWFEAFDEPWKVVYNTPGQEWEDKWGLMDPGRKLKSGLKIPDCGGKTVA